MLLVKLIEPPCTERYARWCERSEFLNQEKFLLLDFVKYAIFKDREIQLCDCIKGREKRRKYALGGEVKTCHEFVIKI